MLKQVKLVTKLKNISNLTNFILMFLGDTQALYLEMSDEDQIETGVH